MCACFATCCLAQNRAEIFLDFEHQGTSGEGFLQTKVVQLPKMTKQSGRFFACSPLQKQVWAADEKILKPHQKYTRTQANTRKTAFCLALPQAVVNFADGFALFDRQDHRLFFREHQRCWPHANGALCSKAASPIHYKIHKERKTCLKEK